MVFGGERFAWGEDNRTLTGWVQRFRVVPPDGSVARHLVLLVKLHSDSAAHDGFPVAGVYFFCGAGEESFGAFIVHWFAF